MLNRMLEGPLCLTLLFNGHVKEITINDYDKAIYAFWFSVLYDTKRLCRKIENTEVSMENWRYQKKIQNNKANVKDLLRLGFSTFFLNRTNYSGIIDGGMIGGISQMESIKLIVV